MHPRYSGVRSCLTVHIRVCGAACCWPLLLCAVWLINDSSFLKGFVVFLLFKLCHGVTMRGVAGCSVTRLDGLCGCFVNCCHSVTIRGIAGCPRCCFVSVCTSQIKAACLHPHRHTTDHTNQLLADTPTCICSCESMLWICPVNCMGERQPHPRVAC
jgi:hypothetical protein